jgi:cytochrome c-type biogenesis protein CcmH/NrfG
MDIATLVFNALSDNSSKPAHELFKALVSTTPTDPRAAGLLALLNEGAREHMDAMRAASRIAA